MTDAWQNFFIAQAGASAALLGLLFVGVSLNLTKILSFAILPNRALLALMLLLAVLVIALLLLVPGQPNWLAAAELLMAGLIVSATGVAVGVQGYRRAQSHRLAVTGNILLSEFSGCPYLVAAYLLFVDRAAAAMFWVAGAMIISLIKAVTDAWVLLVEINR